ncbi:hypothetical protein N7540_000167 [Penicillium herquei]|nr:hypothetical protein N7540_000167 [Penicillium herquei]
MLLSTLIDGFGRVWGISPIPPSWNAEQVHEHYFHHKTGCRAGSSLLLIAGILWLPWSALITKQMRQIENVDPIVCDLQLVAAAAGTFTFILPAIFLALITYRDYGPELTLLLSDLFWVTSVIQWPTFWLQSWCIAWAVLADKSPYPKMPKVVRIINFITGLSFTMATGLHTVYHGPFAWDGALTYWVPLGLFGVEMGIDCFFLIRNINAER